LKSASLKERYALGLKPEGLFLKAEGRSLKPEGLLLKSRLPGRSQGRSLEGTLFKP